MSIIYSGTTVLTPKYGTTELDTVKYGSTTVFERPKELILIDENSPGFSTTYGIYYCDLNGSSDDAYEVAGWAAPPKNIVFDCTYFNKLEITCLGRITDTWQPSMINWAWLWAGIRDYDTLTKENAGNPTGGAGVCLMYGKKETDWQGSLWRPQGGLFVNEYGTVNTGTIATGTCDISALTGNHTFRIWTYFDSLTAFHTEWYVRVFKVRAYR